MLGGDVQEEQQKEDGELVKGDVELRLKPILLSTIRTNLGESVLMSAAIISELNLLWHKSQVEPPCLPQLRRCGL